MLKCKSKINFLVITTLLVFLFLIQYTSAITATSSSYSIGMSGNGIQAGNLSSITYLDHFITVSDGTTRNGQSSSYTANIGFYENTIPSITVNINSYSISPKSAVVGSTIGLYISALNYQKVWANIIAPNGQSQLVDLVNSQFVYYLPNPSVVGRYNVTFYANSSLGTIATVVDYFDLTPSVIIPITTSAAIAGASCNYIWDCDSWSVCSPQGLQERVCKNIGTCPGITGKPLEKRNCSDALFDVALNLDNLTISQDNTLKFKVLLAEILGIDKIDVQIKYSILDENNNEQFSQIETKAIKGSLTYEKELKDIELSPGKYTLRIDIIYGNLQKAFAQQDFEVIKEQIETPAEKLSLFEKILASFNSLNQNIKNILNNFSLAKLIEGLKWIGLIVLALLILVVIIYSLRKIRFGHFFKHFKKDKGNRLRSLIGRKIYTESGIYLGKIEEVIIYNSKIDSFKVVLDKKHKFNAKGIVISYSNVIGVGEVVVVDSKILETLQK